jgi:[acyl-carrier-protein] S-malonyltransferase
MAHIAFVFPGQGSQKVGMGLDLYQNSPAAREVFEECDRALDFPLSQLCFQGPEEELEQTIHAQPAIVATSVACLRAAAELRSGFQPSLLAGHSLGEYTALVAAGVLEFGDGIRLVRERGRLMHQAGARQPGGMAAIIGLDEPSLAQLCQEAGVEIANINSPNQIVISGAMEALNQAMQLARSRGARVVPLEVSGAFHSQLMKPAADELARIISELYFRDPEVPIVVNTTAQPATTAQEIKEELAQQLLHCVRWRHSVQYMIDHGVSTFIEIGPGSVLAGLIKRIDKGVQILNISDMSSMGALSFSPGMG